MRSGQRLIFWVSVSGALVVALVLAIGIYLEEFREAPPVDKVSCEVKGSGVLRNAQQEPLRGRPLGWLPGDDRIEWVHFDPGAMTFARSRWLERDAYGQGQPLWSRGLVCVPRGGGDCEGYLLPGKYRVLDSGFSHGAGWLRLETGVGVRQVPVRWSTDGFRVGSALGMCGQEFPADAQLTGAWLVDGWSVWAAHEGLLARYRIDSRAPFHPQQVPGHADTLWSVGAEGVTQLACPATPGAWSFDRVVAHDRQVFVRVLGQGMGAGESLDAWIWSGSGWRSQRLSVPWRGALASWQFGADGDLLVETTDWWGRSPTARIAQRDGSALNVIWESPVSGKAQWSEVQGASRKSWIRWPERAFSWGRSVNALLLRQGEQGYELSEIRLESSLAIEKGAPVLIRERAPGDYLVISADRDERVVSTRIQCKL